MYCGKPIAIFVMAVALMRREGDNKIIQWTPMVTNTTARSSLGGATY